jgi:hypothetical protein
MEVQRIRKRLVLPGITLIVCIFLVGCRVSDFEKLFSRIPSSRSSSQAQQSSGVEIPNGKGLIWLVLAGASGGVQMPPESEFSKFELRFMEREGDFWVVDANKGPAAVKTRGLSAADDPLFLDPGTYKLHVVAYVQDSPAARGETDVFVLEEKKEQFLYVSFRPISDGANGHFSWTIQFPEDKTSTAGFKFYKIDNLDTPEAVMVFRDGNNGSGWLGKALIPGGFIPEETEISNGDAVGKGFAELPPGDYYLSTIMYYDGQLYGRNDIISVFSSLETPVGYSFARGDFIKSVGLSGTSAITLNGQAVQPYVLLYQGADPVSYFADAQRMVSMFPITGTMWERQIYAENGMILQFVAAVLYNNIPFFSSIKTITIGQDDYVSGIDLTGVMQIGMINGAASVAYTGTEGFSFYYVNIQAYGDPGFKELLNETGLGADGAWSMPMPERPVYYFKIQADLGAGTTVVKLEKQMSASPVNGTIDLGYIPFEGNGSSPAAGAPPPAAPQSALQPAASTGQAAPAASQSAAFQPAALDPTPDYSGLASFFARPSPRPPDPVASPATAAVPSAQPAPAARTPVLPPEPAGPVKLSASRDPQEVLDTLFIGQSLRETPQSPEVGYLIAFDEQYDPSFFDVLGWEIDGYPLGEYTPILDAAGNPEKDEWGYDKFNFTPYTLTTIFLNYSTLEPGKSHEAKITVVRNGINYSRSWIVRAP